MTFLPIVERELRVAARRPGTYWVRFGVAGTLLGLMAGFYGISVVFGLDWLAGGQNLFLVLQWCALPFLTGFGVFLTADALSEEKREGTLGLLFLTDLRGHDVVLGKLAAQAARGFWAALAALPVVGLTILLGGVSGTWFLRVILVIGNSLFLSLALGLLMSAASRNGFKAVNDRWGHEAGDFVLSRLGKRLSAALRDSDLVARVGGDEFVALALEVDQRSTIVSIAEKLSTAITEPLNWEGNELKLGVSIGIAIFPDSATDADTLMNRADAAMYQVKKGGKNNWAFADD